MSALRAQRRGDPVAPTLGPLGTQCLSLSDIGVSQGSIRFKAKLEMHVLGPSFLVPEKHYLPSTSTETTGLLTLSLLAISRLI